MIRSSRSVSIITKPPRLLPAYRYQPTRDLESTEASPYRIRADVSYMPFFRRKRNAHHAEISRFSLTVRQSIESEERQQRGPMLEKRYICVFSGALLSRAASPRKMFVLQPARGALFIDPHTTSYCIRVSTVQVYPSQREGGGGERQLVGQGVASLAVAQLLHLQYSRSTSHDDVGTSSFIRVLCSAWQ